MVTERILRASGLCVTERAKGLRNLPEGQKNNWEEGRRATAWMGLAMPRETVKHMPLGWTVRRAVAKCAPELEATGA